MKHRVIVRDHPGGQFAHFILYAVWLALISAVISTPILILVKELFQVSGQLTFTMLLVMVCSHIFVKKYPKLFVITTFITSLIFILYLSNLDWEKILVGFIFTSFYHLLIWDYLLPDQSILWLKD